ncbi:MAG TPA: hypothetical protein VK454_08650, partial [Myxococcaceae bacterium]|nr:hypothetical protein [Myxococcaceae bacterium]
LEGGRLDYVGGRPVAALVYRARQHVINVLIWADPGAADRAPGIESRNGIHAIHWTNGGMAFWVVSELSEDELQRLVALLHEPVP